MGVVSRLKSALGFGSTDPGTVETRAPYIGDEVQALVNGRRVEGTVQALETREAGDWHAHIDSEPKVLTKSEVVEVTTPDERETLPDHPAFEDSQELPDHPVFQDD